MFLLLFLFFYFLVGMRLYVIFFLARAVDCGVIIMLRIADLYEEYDYGQYNDGPIGDEDIKEPSRSSRFYDTGGT